MSKKKSVWLAIFIAFLAAVTLATHSFALSIATSAITFTGVTLNGFDQTVAGSTGAWRVDATGEAGGWNSTIAATDFSNGVGGTIAVSDLEFRLADANITLVSGDPTLPISTQTGYISLSGTAIKFISAASGTGDGVYDLLPELRLTVPAETYIGNYTCTITIATNSGP